MRYLFFIIRYRQRFNNQGNVRGFLDQTIPRLLQGTLRLVAKLKKLNKQLAEKNTEIPVKLRKIILHSTLYSAEYDASNSDSLTELTIAFLFKSIPIPVVHFAPDCVAHYTPEYSIN